MIQEFDNNILFRIISKFREEKELEYLLLLYLMYYCGLNFYMISRIMIKYLKSSFRTLVIKKRKKKEGSQHS